MVFVSHFPRFSVFLTIFQVLQYVFFIFNNFRFSRHIPGPIMCDLIFHAFQYFSQYSWSSSVHFAFSMIFNFFAIFQVPQ
jgi:hypothetical protein